MNRIGLIFSRSYTENLIDSIVIFGARTVSKTGCTICRQVELLFISVAVAEWIRAQLRNREELRVRIDFSGISFSYQFQPRVNITIIYCKT